MEYVAEALAALPDDLVEEAHRHFDGQDPAHDLPERGESIIRTRISTSIFIIGKTWLVLKTNICSNFRLIIAVNVL